MWMKFAGVISGGLLLSVLISVIRTSTDLAGKKAELNTGDIGLINNLGKVLFNDYAVPFEISSVLFLSAMVGAVVIGKKIIKGGKNLILKKGQWRWKIMPIQYYIALSIGFVLHRYHRCAYTPQCYHYFYVC